MTASFGTRLFNTLHERKRDLFFIGVALFALGTVVRRELMVKGMIENPNRKEATKGLPRVERGSSPPEGMRLSPFFGDCGVVWCCVFGLDSLVDENVGRS